MKNRCRYEDWDDTCFVNSKPAIVCHCQKRDNVDCANAPNDVASCPDYRPFNPFYSRNPDGSLTQ